MQFLLSDRRSKATRAEAHPAASHARVKRLEKWTRSTELVAEATLALRLECTVEELVRTIHAHPTMSEAVAEAAHAVHGGAIHA